MDKYCALACYYLDMLYTRNLKHIWFLNNRTLPNTFIRKINPCKNVLGTTLSYTSRNFLQLM